MPTEARLPEVTLRSVLWGILLCIIFTVASAYSGLKVGQVMESAIPILILTIGLARACRRRSTVLENVIPALPEGPGAWWRERSSRYRRFIS